MTKKPGDEGRVVEMDAMDENEWEKDKLTPIVTHEQMSKLVEASSDATPARASTSARTANTIPSQSANQSSGAKLMPKPDGTPPRSAPAPASPSATKHATPAAAKKDATPAPAKPGSPATVRKDATPGPAHPASPATVKRPIRPAALPPSASPRETQPMGSGSSSSIKPNDGSSPGVVKPIGDTGSSGIAKVGADAPSTGTRKLPLPPPRAAGRTAPPPPTRPAPPPRAGAFAFASSTPAEVAKSDAPAKPTSAQIGPTSFEADEDLAIARTPTSEPAVIGPPIVTSRESLEALQPPSKDAAVVTAPPISEPNPFDDQVWRAEGGSDSSADVEIAGAHPILGGNPLRESIAAFVKNKRNLAIAAGGVVVLVVLIVMMSGGTKPSTKASNKRVAKTEPAAMAAPVETPPAETPPEQPVAAATPPTETPPAETPPAETPPAETPAATPSEGSGSATTHTVSGAKKKSGSTIGGKQVVLEYDTQAREAKPVPNAPKQDQDAISKARTSYAAGNTRLFAGDADGAIKNYKQALGYYPAYVAAYRGLGLAYAQKGDKAAAKKALRTYVGAAPSAKDAGLIRKRIEMLGN